MTTRVEVEVVEAIERPARERGSVSAPVPIADGPLSAALFAAGIGTFVLGLLTTLAEASPGLKTALALNAGVGPLSGKTIWAVVAFVVSWVILGIALRPRDGLLRTATIVFLVLVALGLLGTFPIFYEAFAG